MFSNLRLPPTSKYSQYVIYVVAMVAMGPNTSIVYVGRYDHQYKLISRSCCMLINVEGTNVSNDDEGWAGYLTDCHFFNAAPLQLLLGPCSMMMGG